MRLKFLFLGVLISLSINTFAASAQQYITISISGMDNPPNAQDLTRTRETIAGFVKDLKVKEYKLAAMGTDGGFFACILPWSESAANSMWMTIDSLPIDSTQTIFNARHSEDCE